MDVMSRTTLATVRHENGVHILGQMLQIGNARLTKTPILFEYVSMSAMGSSAQQQINAERMNSGWAKR